MVFSKLDKVTATCDVLQAQSARTSFRLEEPRLPNQNDIFFVNLMLVSSYSYRRDPGFLGIYRVDLGLALAEEGRRRYTRCPDSLHSFHSEAETTSAVLSSSGEIYMPFR